LAPHGRVRVCALQAFDERRQLLPVGSQQRSDGKRRQTLQLASLDACVERQLMEVIAMLNERLSEQLVRVEAPGLKCPQRFAVALRTVRPYLLRLNLGQTTEPLDRIWDIHEHRLVVEQRHPVFEFAQHALMR
jgi:hypothetical protein